MYAQTANTAAPTRTARTGANDALMTTANVTQNKESPTMTGGAGACTVSCFLPNASAPAPITANAIVANSSGAPTTAPMPMSTLLRSPNTTSAINATIVSGSEEPTAATTAPTALRVSRNIAPTHSTAFAKASLARTRSTSPKRTWSAIGTGHPFWPVTSVPFLEIQG